MRTDDLLLRVECYVAVRKALGYAVRSEEKLLKDFIQFLELVQQVVARADCDGAGTDDRDHFLHFHAIEELVPKRLVQFSDHHWCVNRVRHRFLDIRYFTVRLVLKTRLSQQKTRLSQQRRLDAAHMRYVREQALPIICKMQLRCNILFIRYLTAFIRSYILANPTGFSDRNFLNLIKC
jgi:hypothetical protein